jgi:hypothetical protein
MPIIEPISTFKINELEEEGEEQENNNKTMMNEPRRDNHRIYIGRRTGDTQGKKSEK